MVAKKKKKKADYTLIQKRSKRWAVQAKDGKFINGDEKVKILLKEGKIKINSPKKKKAVEATDKAADAAEKETK